MWPLRVEESSMFNGFRNCSPDYSCAGKGCLAAIIVQQEVSELLVCTSAR